MNNQNIISRPIEFNNVELIRHKLNKTFRDNAFMRQIFRTKYVNDSNKDIEFVKIGSNEITERAWFVDQKGLDTLWDFKPLGEIKGRRIAHLENSTIINKILTECKGGCPEVTNLKLSEELFAKLFKDKNYDVVITNVYDSHLFWNMKNFKPQNKKEIPFCEGSIFERKIFSASTMPKGTTIVLDSTVFGEILEKMSLSLKITEEVDKNITLESLQKLKNRDLRELVKILIYETIGFKIIDKNAMVIIKTEIANKDNKQNGQKITI